MKAALTRYRVMATIVGILLIVLVLVGVPLKYVHYPLPNLFPGFLSEGMPGQQLGANICKYLGIAHGWLYMIFLLVAFHLSRLARWSLAFTVSTLLCGTVPLLSFWAERRATRHVRAEHHLDR